MCAVLWDTNPLSTFARLPVVVVAGRWHTRLTHRSALVAVCRHTHPVTAYGEANLAGCRWSSSLAQTKAAVYRRGQQLVHASALALSERRRVSGLPVVGVVG